MKLKPNWWMILSAVCLLISPAIVRGAEIIQIRTGQVGGSPGACPNPDDSFRYNVTFPGCSLPLRNVPFSAADFAGAAGGPPARLITPWSVYLPSLSFDPQARWINWREASNCYGGIPASILYAVPFTVHTPCGPTGTIQVCWAVDDFLGDQLAGGPNPVGIYVNGVALNPGFSGGNYATETCFQQSGVPLNTGLNYLYVYQRDAACSTSGLLLSAQITVNPTTCPSIGVLKFNDVNGNGVQDGGEPGLPGWQINISGPSNQSATTDGSGTALFRCVPPGVYQITEVMQPGWIQTYPTGGIQTLNVSCGQDYVASFGNRICDQGQGQCVPVPSCLSAWWPFNECSGTVANEIVANRDGTIVGGSGNPTWGAGRPGSPCGLRIPGSPGTQLVVMPDYPEHDFGTGSFTIFSWVRTLNNDGTIKTIVDKRDVPFLTPTGYALYHVNGVLKFQFDDGSGFPTNYVSTAPAINDGNWHTVAISVCRNPNSPSQNVARLFVDNYSDTFTLGIPTGSLSNNAGLRFGDQCPGFITGIPFDGAIDDVMLFKCCLSANQIASLRTDFPYCSETCYVPTNLGTPFASISTTLTLCNYSLTPQTYTWTIAGLPAGTGCSVNGPTSFLPASGTVTLPAATSGPACMNIPITVVLPGGMVPGQTTCYQVTTQNMGSGRCCTTKGRIRKLWKWHIDWNPSFYDLPPNVNTPVRFRVHNDWDTPLDYSYKLSGNSSDGDNANQVVSLNGLPPGQPFYDVLQIAPHDSADVVVTAALTAFQPLNINEIILEADTDGDGAIEQASSAALQSIPDQTAADAPGEQPGVPPTVGLTDELSVFPNPFHHEIGIHLSMARPQKTVRVEVFDVGGRLVRVLFDGPLGAGSHNFTWDGRDGRNQPTGHGIYFVRVRSERVGLQTKLIQLE